MSTFMDMQKWTGQCQYRPEVLNSRKDQLMELMLVDERCDIVAFQGFPRKHETPSLRNIKDGNVRP